ncbi:GGDEF domain-containing protein [Pontibacter chitinilyticus]|uniref:GGDEF domain-containing protein n=1 Tax=Pontibacter chitinilyticus TaxID=2674989 RepID=UPI00321B59B9
MSNYFKESFKKFKADALAKGVYDVLKWLFIALVVFAFARFIPNDTNYFSIINYKFQISLYWVIIYTIVIILASVVLAFLTFKQKYKKVETDNFTDELTGLKNHKALKYYLEKQLEDSSKSIGKNLSIILLDVDNFKHFNTDYGYITSDQVLKKLGELLGNDKRVTDETFRFFNRGDEFLIVANETSANDALLAAERKRKLIERTGFSVNDKSYYLKVSCGITEYKKGDNYQSIIDRVNSALGEAKGQTGKNCSKIIV